MVRRGDRNDARRFHTQLAMGLTFSWLILFGLLSFLTNYRINSQENTSRFLFQQDDYSSYSCNELFDKVQDKQEQCQFAKTCNQGQGIWASWVFCGRHSVRLTVGLLSPLIILWLVLLFRMLGSTAEDFFSPALEMFSVQLGLPPRFAGVSLLALGNGAADVSATISAIANDPQNGYQLSLGALTGAAMVIGSVVSALVVITAGGVPCRGALVRDVTALGLTVLLVWNQFATRQTIGPDTISLFLSLYCIFVVIVLMADVYHRAVVVPRLQDAAARAELERQHQVGVAAHQALGGEESNAQLPPPASTGRLDRFVTALSNYDNSNTTGEQQWQGIESDDLMHDRPVLLHGAQGILTEHPPATPERSSDDGQNYHMLEDTTDNLCVDPHSLGVPAADWKEALFGAYQEIRQHFADEWEDIVHNGDLDIASKALLITEFPVVCLRKITVSIPCEGYYVRSLVSLSLVGSIPWFAFYMWSNNDTNIMGIVFFVAWAIMGVLALAVLRLAPAGNMSLTAAAPIALYGFVMGATWIDAIANNLVSVLDFVGIVLRIPGPVVGLTILAWGNSMSDLSANITMARKGLANMAMTACFAGPLFNILMGLGLGFSNLAARTGQSSFAVSVDSSVSVGFLFIAVNSLVIIVFGLFFGGGTIPKKYGYVALSLYTIYLICALVLQYV